MLKEKPTLYNIPAGLSFSDCLAEGILQKYANNPELLASMTIFLPSKRGIRALQDSFLKRRKGRLMILPSLRALGDGLDEEPSLLVQDNISASHVLTQNNQITGGIRQLALTRIILSHIRGKAADLSYPDALSMAVSVLELLDSLQSERIAFEDLQTLDVGLHTKAWQDNLDILNIIMQKWPEFLDKHHLIEPAPYRNAVLETLTQCWQDNPPNRPIIAAGSTGSMPASADFMKLIGRLPQGCVVLPGLDMSMPELESDMLYPDHPQYGLHHLLKHFDVSKQDIHNWHAVHDFITPKHTARQKFFHEIMRPAGTAEQWFNMPQRITDDEMRLALQGLKLIKADTEQDEAMAIALIMRETLETPTQNVVLITPNRILARRVTSILRRWDIVPDDSAGIPLSDHPQGVFLKLMFDVLKHDFSPVCLLAFLKHPLVCMGYPRGYFKKYIRLFEDSLLRGNRPPSGIRGLRQHLNHYIKRKTYHLTEQSPEYAEIQQKILTLNTTLEIIERAFYPLLNITDKISMKDFLEKLIFSIECITAVSDVITQEKQYFWQGDAGRAMHTMLFDFIHHSDVMGKMPVMAIRTHLTEFTAKIPVRNSFNLSKRVFIWGTPEARLQHTDVVILGGLTEGSWPISPDTGIWLSRIMRKNIGLSAPERRIGLSAHDFVQAGCTDKVFLTTALKSDSGIVSPSRWLIRIENILKSLFDNHNILSSESLLYQLNDTPYAVWAKKMDISDIKMPPLLCPMPKPPVSVRPRIISVTDAEKWQRDPYYIYAKYILNLRKKRFIDEAVQSSDKGTVIHQVLHDFMQHYSETAQHNGFDMMMSIAEKKLLEYADYPAMVTFWRPRLKTIMRAFIEAEHKIKHNRTPVSLECAGELSFPAPAGLFTIKARADRIDKSTQGGLIIVDYKTSKTGLSYKKLELGLLPQIPLQAIMAQNGGFETVPADYVISGEYIFLTGKKDLPYERMVLNPNEKSHFTDFNQMIHHIYDGFIHWVSRFDDENTPYPSRRLPDMLNYAGDYDHLARTKQWSL